MRTLWRALVAWLNREPVDLDALDRNRYPYGK